MKTEPDSPSKLMLKKDFFIQNNKEDIRKYYEFDNKVLFLFIFRNWVVAHME